MITIITAWSFSRPPNYQYYYQPCKGAYDDSDDTVVLYEFASHPCCHRSRIWFGRTFANYLSDIFYRHHLKRTCHQREQTCESQMNVLKSFFLMKSETWFIQNFT